MKDFIHPQPNRWQRLLLAAAILLASLLSLVPPAQAQEIVFKDSIPAGQTVENDAILTGIDISLAGDVVGDVLVVGTNVNVSGNVDGSLIALGQHVNLSGPVAGTTLVISLDLLLESTAQLARNLYYLGLSLETQEGSQIGRDLVTIALGGTLHGQVNRETRAILGPVEVIRMLIGKVSTQPVSLAVPAPLAAAPSESRVQFSGFTPTMRGASSSGWQQAQIDTARLQAWFLGVVRSLITLLVFGLLGLWLFPRQIAQATSLTRRHPWQAIGIGLLVLVIAFSLILVVGLLFAMILAVGLWFSSLQLTGLALVVWSVGFSSLLLLSSLAALFVAYGTKVIVAFLLGGLILARLSPRAAQQRLWPLLLGLVLYVLLASIPGLGWVIAVLVTALGLGATWQLFRQRGRPPAGVEPVEFIEEVSV